jgi:methyl-accepting chemotaxis protein
MSGRATVSRLIATGFSIVILIALALGGLGVWTMLGAKRSATIMADEYVPEVKVASDLRGAANRLMFHMRGYETTEDDSHYSMAKDELALLANGLKEASDLADRAKHLTALEGQVKRVSDAVEDYEDLIAQTETAIGALNVQRGKLDSNAATYMQNCAEFLKGQNDAFRQDLDTRQQKITLATAISDLGTSVRVGNFKAQAEGDAEMMRATVSELEKLDTHTVALRKITFDQEDIDRIDEIEAAAEAYGKSMGAYAQALGSGAGGDESVLGAQREAMDQAAARYVTNGQAFLQAQQEKLATDMQERHRKISLVNDIIDLGNDARVKAFKAQAIRDLSLIDDALKNFALLDEKYDELRQITRLDVDLTRIDRTQQAGQSYAKALQDFRTEWNRMDELRGKRLVAANAMIDACAATTEAGLTNTDTLAKGAAGSLTLSSIVMVVGLIVGAVFSVAAALWIARRITVPLSRAVESLSSGAEQVTSASGQVSSASQSLAEGSSEQASSLEETSASLEEMTSMTKQNADNAKQVTVLAEQALGDAETGTGAMQRMNEAMGKIKRSSDETAGIVKTIEEIAFQTNLLALNAAVEAARAGDAGKGFAVVAEEVRNLAQRAAEAARNTGQLITGSVKDAENGVEVSQEVAASLEKIAAAVGKVNEISREVAAASDEQAEGIDQVNLAVAEMDKVTQANAANSEESASAAEELNAQAEEMMAVVQELGTLVGGRAAALDLGGSRAVSRVRAGSPDVRALVPQARSRSGAVSHTPARQRPAKPASGNGKADRHQSKAVVDAARVIPLDDDDFSEF